MTFDTLKTIQADAYRVLQNSFFLEKLSHAYLFEGFTGCGKDEMALYMAMQLVCTKTNKPCLECESCKKVLSSNHMNVVIIRPSTEIIKKEQIDDLIREFSMTSLEGGNQVYIIYEAEKMNASASNALLKFLEEPMPNRYGFLVTSNKERILSTILSRTQIIHFKPVSTTNIVEALELNGVEKDIAYCATTLTNDIDEIKKLISEGKIIDFVDFARKVVLATFKKEDPFVVYYLHKDLLQEENKMWHRFLFDILALMYQEAIKFKNNKEVKYFKKNFKDIADLKDIDINTKLELIIENQKRLNYYVSMPLFYTNFFCKLGKEK